MACLLPGNSLVENIAVNNNNNQTVVKTSHVTVTQVSEMHLVGCYQRIALISATHVLIVSFASMWKPFVMLYVPLLLLKTVILSAL